MALYRQLQLSFWGDAFVIDLTPEEKFFYVYLLQCTNTKQCGIFELPKRTIEYETGYNRDTIDKLLERFVNYGKIIYCEKTKEIMIINWIKYNFINSRNTIICINKELKEVKNKEFVLKFYEICKNLGYPLESIFKDIEEVKDNFRALQGAYKDLGEEEIKEEIKIKEVEVEEVQKEVKEKAQVEEVQEIQEEQAREAATADFCENKVIKAFNSNIHPITPIEFEKLMDWERDMSSDVILLAIEEAVNHNARTMSYINSVLNNWHSLGFATREDILSYKRDWKDKKSSASATLEEFNGPNAQAYRYVE